MVVPKAAIYQTQTFYAKGKMKEIKQLVANLRGESLSSGKTETWNGKMLKIPPVSPSILDCSIIRVEYSLMVSYEPSRLILIKHLIKFAEAYNAKPERLLFLLIFNLLGTNLYIWSLF